MLHILITIEISFDLYILLGGKRKSLLYLFKALLKFFFLRNWKIIKGGDEVENVSEDKMLAFSQSIQGRVTFWSECIYEYHQKLMLHYKMTIEWTESFYKLLPGFLFWTIFLFYISCLVYQLLESGTANFIHRFSTKMCSLLVRRVGGPTTCQPVPQKIDDWLLSHRQLTSLPSVVCTVRCQ